MSDGDQERVLYSLPPQDRTGVFMGMSLGQVIIAGGGVLFGIIIMAAVNVFAGVLFLLGSVAFGLMRYQGRPLFLSLPLLFGRVVGRSDATWQRPVPLLGRSGDKLPGPLAGQRIMPVQLRDIGWTQALEGADAGVVLDRRGLMTASVTAQAPQFLLADPLEKDRRLKAWSEFLSASAHENGLIACVRWVEFTTVEGIVEHLDWIRGELTDEPIEAVRDAYIELITNNSAATLQHHIVLSLSIRVSSVRPPPKVPRNFAAARVLLSEIERTIMWCAEQGMDVSGPLSTQETLRLVMRRLDPMRGYNTVVIERRPDGAAAAEPLTAREHWQHWQVDSTFHRALLVREWPRRATYADWMGGLLQRPSGVRSVAVFAEPVPTSTSLRTVNRRAVRVLAEMDARQGKGFRITGKHTRALDEHERLEQELVAGHPEFLYCGIVTLAAPDLETLNAMTEDTISRAAGTGVDMAPLNGRHPAAVAATLPTSGGIIGIVR